LHYARTPLSRDGDGEYEFVGTLRRRLYLNEVTGQGLGARQRGGAMVAAAPSRQDVSRIQGVGDAGRRPQRFPDQGITLVG
jgi:hypothetical protein